MIQRTLAILLLATALAAAQSDLTKLGTEAARLRGLSYRPVKSSVVTQKQAADYVLRLLDQELEPKRTMARELFLKSLGLLPRKSTIRGVLGKLYAGQVRGLYDPGKKVYLVVRDTEPTQDAALAASLGLDATDMYAVHELGHAIQDQHFDLDAISRRVTPNLDQAFAAQTLIEGDASLLMMDYSMGKLGLDLAGLPLQGLDFQGLAGADPALASTPPFFREYVTGPYMQGLTFVSALRTRGGWKAVDAAFRNLPASSEQVFHPEKYLNKSDPPKTVRLATLPKAFGNFKALADDTAGEVTVRVLCSQAGADMTAAEGWGGDRFRAFFDGKQGFVIWVTVWDTVRDAKEFEGLIKTVRKDATITRKNLMVTTALDVPPSVAKKMGAP